MGQRREQPAEGRVANRVERVGLVLEHERRRAGRSAAAAGASQEVAVRAYRFSASAIADSIGGIEADPLGALVPLRVDHDHRREVVDPERVGGGLIGVERRPAPSDACGRSRARRRPARRRRPRPRRPPDAARAKRWISGIDCWHGSHQVAQKSRNIDAAPLAGRLKATAVEAWPATPAAPGRCASRPSRGATKNSKSAKRTISAASTSSPRVTQRRAEGIFAEVRTDCNAHPTCDA